MIKRWMVVLGVMMLCTLAVVPAVSAKANGSDRPLKSAMTGEVTWQFDWASETCPVTTVTDTFGTMSHLGKVSAHWTHCPNVFDEYPAYTNGHVVFTAANGDAFEGVYMDYDGAPPFVIEITGGTGRFHDASGTIELVSFDVYGAWDEDLDIPIEPWSWEGFVKGTISY